MFMARAKPSKELRASILDEARQTLVAEGYRALSMRRIARAVGCTATSIYLHFRDKDDLLHALIHEGLERLHEQLLASVDGIEDPLRRCQRLCRSYLEFALENREYYEVIFSLHPEHMKRYPQALYRRARENLEYFADALAAAAGRAGDRRDEDILHAHVIWAQLHGAVSLHLDERLDFRIDVLAFLDAAVANALCAVPHPDEQE
ncbi:MAG: TetR family transcriptional regulator [Planctomycetes bacterium]|nr:TetR family transcriptional regulator [Planctomycetota bacterium]